MWPRGGFELLKSSRITERRSACRGMPLQSKQGTTAMAKILCVLFDDPIDGYPPACARDDIPIIDHYPGGQTAPTPKAIGFKPGTLLGSVSGELGLRTYLQGLGHQFVVTSDKDGPNSKVRA
jgi:hypothetical protein